MSNGVTRARMLTITTALVGGLVSGVAPAAAALRIADDPGGRIGSYVETYTAARDAGERVVIDGPCLSACTLLLGIFPRERICVTARAKLGFHAAWSTDHTGRRIISADGTRALWDIYPPPVRRWIKRNGGLSQTMIYLHDRQLKELYAPCR
jgi:hypothetical protein